MEHRMNQMLLLVLLYSFVLLNPTNAMCASRNSAGTYNPQLGSPQQPVSTPPPPQNGATPPPSLVAPPPLEVITPPPSSYSPPPPKVSTPPPSPVSLPALEPETPPPPCPKSSSSPEVDSPPQTSPPRTKETPPPPTATPPPPTLVSTPPPPTLVSIPPPPVAMPPPPSLVSTPPPPTSISIPPPPTATPPPISTPPPPAATPPPQPATYTPQLSNTSSGVIAKLSGPVALKLKSLCTELTSYPEICESTMAPFLVGQASLDDMMVVLQASIKVAINETNALIELVTQYEAKAPYPAMLTSLKSCKDDFNDALEDIQTAVDAISSGDYGTLTTYLSSAIDDYGQCDDEFMGINPLLNQNARLRHIVDNCLAFAEDMQWS